MKKFNLRICVFAMLSSLFSFGLAQSLGFTPITFTIQNGNITGNSHKWRRSPASNQTLPVVFYDIAEECLYFDSKELIDGLSVQILDESEIVVKQQIIRIQPGEYTTINVNYLSEGIYYIRTYMKGRTYIGEFEVEGI